MATPIAIWRQASQRRDGRENLITFCCPMLYLCCPRDGYRDVISVGLSRFGDPRRRSAICVAVPRQLSRYGEAPSCAMQAIAAHHAVPRPSRNRDFGRNSRRQGCATGPMTHSSNRQVRQARLPSAPGGAVRGRPHSVSPGNN